MQNWPDGCEFVVWARYDDLARAEQWGVFSSLSLAKEYREDCLRVARENKRVLHVGITPNIPQRNAACRRVLEAS